MGAGRFLCVALPFGLTLASLVCVMIAMLAGVSNRSLDMFEVTTQNLSVSTSTLLQIEGLANQTSGSSSIGALTAAAIGPNAANITAADLGLADYYRVSLWNYCSITGTQTNCTKAAYNWAATATNLTEMKTVVAQKINYNNATLPKELSGALKTFQTVHKWVQIVYTIAILTTLVTLILGLFAICSRVGSCFTYIVSGVSTLTTIVATVMATAESAIIVGAIKAVENSYHIDAALNSSWLGTAWLAVVFSIGAGVFWSLSICCCAADHHKKNRKGDQEKLIGGNSAYQPLGEQHNGQQSGIYPGGAPVPMKPMRNNGAYEPYSHSNI